MAAKSPYGELSGELLPLQASSGSLPTGIVTFLYTDIEGSTRLRQEQPERMPHALERHDALITQAVEAHEGLIFRTMGDALCAAFSSPSAALSVACHAQRSLAGELWERASPLRVRMAVHTGAAEVSGGDYVGHALNRVAHLLSAG